MHEMRLVEMRFLGLQALLLALQCLSFDFVGTCLDDSSEDFGTIQVSSLLKRELIILFDLCTRQ